MTAPPIPERQELPVLAAAEGDPIVAAVGERLAAGDASGALTIAEAACARAPANVFYPLLAGAAAQGAGLEDVAIRWFERTLALAPSQPEALAWLAASMRRRGEPDLAMRLATRALEHRPDHGPALLARAQARYDLGDAPGALAALDAHAARHGESSAAGWIRAFALLALERFDAGWRAHEHRLALATGSASSPAAHAVPWLGEPLEGRSIAVLAEQGLGDQIMMVRFVPLLRARGAGRIVVECGAPLVPLVRTMAGVDAVVARGESLPPTDCAVPISSLPHRLGVGSDLLGRTVPYVSPPGVCPPSLGAMLAAPAPLRIGLVWGGEPRNASDHERSIPLAAFAPLLRLPGFAWYSLQKGPRAAEHETLAPDLRQRLVALGPCLGNFGDTAHAMVRLDVVVTVCTSVAHVAGALGVPTFVLLRRAADWRWFRGRTDSPWYPSARLFRQETRGDWGPVVRDVARALVERLRTRR
ncbi:MAG: CDC27 family protein [Gemmatimonadota bacterium]